ncbi:MAG: arginase [Chlorobi bacterium]|nr:MAG: Arginase family protein [Chlorobi bacterium OLB7]MBK8912803.1 arginase [Chlorobiota bacterium]MBX7217588.1 arginase [Candidatus Kapabacteria bacterium]
MAAKSSAKQPRRKRKPAIHLLGFPMDLGAGRRGVDMGPSALRIADIEGRLKSLGIKVEDEGDIEIQVPEVLKIKNPRLRYLPEITAACEKLARKVKKILKSGDFPLVLGGDHSMAIGTLAGVASYCRDAGKRLGVIWIDAHSDINIPETSPSGNIHGMPVAASIGLGAKELTRVGGDFQKLDPTNIVMIGLRSVDEGERKIIHERDIRAYTMTDIDRKGINTVMEETLDYLQARTDHIHISFDLDSVDPTVASGVGTPVPGGLTWREAHFIMEVLAERGALDSMEVAEVNPILDNLNKGAEFAADLVASAMGKRIL